MWPSSKKQVPPAVHSGVIWVRARSELASWVALQCHSSNLSFEMGLTIPALRATWRVNANPWQGLSSGTRNEPGAGDPH